MNHTRLEELPDLLTVNETTGFLRVSRNTLYDAIRAGTVPSIRLGRRVLIPKAGLQRMLDKIAGCPQSQATNVSSSNTKSPLLVQVPGNGRTK